MQQPTRSTFAGFEIDHKASVLRKHGESVRIGPQAFKALSLLVARGGELVTRDELQKEIWGERVHVDFEHGLNVCIRQIRAALGDDGEGSQIIVTCPREGYRLGVPVTPEAETLRPRHSRWSAVRARWHSLPIHRVSARHLRSAAAIVALAAATYLVAPALSGGGGNPELSQVTATNADGALPVDTSQKAAALFSRSWPTRNVEAYELYWRGRGYYDRSTGGKPFRALPYFERAATLDPGFALAHAGIAVAYVDRSSAGIAPAESVMEAQKASHRAFAIDPDLAETRVALAELSYRVDHDTSKAEQEFIRAVTLDGRNTYVRQRYATFLQEQRRFDEALEQLEVAQELDPLSVKSSWQKSDTLFSAHNYELSLAEAYHTLELDPYHPWSFRNVGRCLEALGRREDAISAYLKAGRVALGQLGRLYAVVGRRDAARQVLMTLTKQRGHDTPEKVHNGVAIAYIYTGLGEPGKAVEWLEKAHHDGVRLPFSLRVAPEWEPLRVSPAFKELLKSTPVSGVSGV